MSRETIEAAGEIVGGILAVLMFVVLTWLYLVVTPDQSSAEADWCRDQMERSAK